MFSLSTLKRYRPDTLDEEEIQQLLEENKETGGPYLHHHFVVTLLNDLYGIQARSGCSCAGPYGHRCFFIIKSRNFNIYIYIKIFLKD